MIISFQSHFMNENHRKYTQKQDESQAFHTHFLNETEKSRAMRDAKLGIFIRRIAGIRLQSE
jgi:hypothetical protein